MGGWDGVGARNMEEKAARKFEWVRTLCLLFLVVARDCVTVHISFQISLFALDVVVGNEGGMSGLG